MSGDPKNSVIALGLVAAGTLLVTDGGFTCMGDHELKLVKAEADGSLYVECADGHHGLDGQECAAGEHEVDFDHYIGFWLEGQEPPKEPVSLADQFKVLLECGLDQATALTTLHDHGDTFPEYAAAVETNDDLEVDDKPLFSKGDGGCWVSSWSWISDEAVGVEPDVAEPENA